MKTPQRRLCQDSSSLFYRVRSLFDNYGVLTSNVIFSFASAVRRKFADNVSRLPFFFLSFSLSLDWLSPFISAVVNDSIGEFCQKERRKEKREITRSQQKKLVTELTKVLLSIGWNQTKTYVDMRDEYKNCSSISITIHPYIRTK